MPLAAAAAAAAAATTSYAVTSACGAAAEHELRMMTSTTSMLFLRLCASASLLSWNVLHNLGHVLTAAYTMKNIIIEVSVYVMLMTSK
jgi:hypothetical protein